jgi:hypothetical protein
MNSKHRHDKNNLSFAADYAKSAKAAGVRQYTMTQGVQQGVRREFRLTIGKLGVIDPTNGMRMPFKAQVREDAETLCTALLLRFHYHPDATYIVSILDQPEYAREQILKALALGRRFIVKQGRNTGDIFITRNKESGANYLETPDSSTDSTPDSGIYSSGDIHEVEELDDLTIYLRQGVEALLASLKPFELKTTQQLELF